MVSIYKNLESVMRDKRPHDFKSEGELRIASFLDSNSIRYQYEPGILVRFPYDKARIWYPDFYLPEFGSYIEYYGLVGRQNYDRGIKTKETVYFKMGIDVIPVFPWTFTEDWEGYIMKELETKTIDAYKNLMSKPYWSERGSGSQPYAPHHQSSHYKRFRNRY